MITDGGLNVNEPAEKSGIERLEPLIGEWSMEASLPMPEGANGDVTTTFEWILNKQFVMERSTAPDPIPDSVNIIAADPDGENYKQHYFDSRNVTRLYSMSFSGGVWKLWRDRADASDFSQRYTGTLSEDGNTIKGAWEIAHDGTTWEHDFDLNYKKVG